MGKVSEAMGAVRVFSIEEIRNFVEEWHLKMQWFSETCKECGFVSAVGIAKKIAVDHVDCPRCGRKVEW